MKRTLLFSLVGLHFMYKMNAINSGHDPSFTLPLKVTHKGEKQMTHKFQLLLEAMISLDATKQNKKKKKQKQKKKKRNSDCKF